MKKFNRYSEKEKVWGWITSGYEFIPTGFFRHIDDILSNPLVKMAVPNMDTMYDDVLDAEESCQQLADLEGDTHAEWHNYEIAIDNFNSSVANALYDSGWIRIGTFGNTIHFEGQSWAIGSKKEFLEDFAESRNMGWEFDKRK